MSTRARLRAPSLATATTVVGALALLAAAPMAATAEEAVEPSTDVAVIPAPSTLLATTAAPAVLGVGTVIKTHPLDDAAIAVGSEFAEFLGRATGYPISVGQRAAGSAQGATIDLSTRGDASLGDEGYVLEVDGTRVSIEAHDAEGLFRGVTTLRQLLPDEIESDDTVDRSWTIPAVSISDAPRYEYRGAMLDVGRRFFPVDDVKRFIDQMALYKLNALHMHLTDDQGWRLTVDARPELTAIGGSTQSGWAPGTGGPWFYTKADYREIVEYAAEHFIEVVPEIDGPGHSTAAKASIPDINCSGVAPAPYTGFNVGLPPVCLTPEKRAEVQAYLVDVLGEAAGQSSSDIVHIGGDEVPSITDEQMDWYVQTAGDILTAEGKRVMGWHQIGSSPLPAGSLIQWWADAGDQASIGTPNERVDVRDLRAALEKGAQVVASPADRAYLDMKYDSTVPYGLSWAGLVDLQRAYEWDPISVTSSPDGSVSLATEEQIAGVEAALWADRAYRGSTKLPTSLDQFIPTSEYADFMSFPRMPAIAEIGWSRAEVRSFDDFERRTVAHADRWDELGIGYYQAPDVPWQE